LIKNDEKIWIKDASNIFNRMNSATDASDVHNNAFFKLVGNSLKFKAFLLRKLPAAYFSGVRLLQADEQKSTVSIPYKWFTRNPFGSTYFACLSMAAEMSTGVLVMAHTYRRKPAVSTLVVQVEGRFDKKAVGVTRFVCEDGLALKALVEQALLTGSAQQIKMTSKGYDAMGALIAEFWITWSLKARAEM
jgi:hypothetical protein